MKDMSKLMRAIRAPIEFIKRQAETVKLVALDTLEDGDGHMVSVEHPRQLILQSDRPLTEEAYARIREQLLTWQGGPIVFDGGLRVVGAIHPPIVADGPAILAPDADDIH